MSEMELAPFRSMEDFMLESARFQVPAMNDPSRWVNRVINNLLYYQTNYFLTTAVIFLLVGIVHPVQMVIGFSAVALAFGGFAYITENNISYKRFKRQHPGLSVVCVLGAGYIVVFFLGSIVVFLFGIAVPLLITIVHASMRMRNMKNKYSNKLEYVGLKRTPMGLILEALGQEQEAGS